jgi:drug/metabolite transporter (DMT)-like permease
MPTFLLILVTIVWGSTFVVIKDTVRSVDPFFIVFARLGIASLAMTGFLAVKDRRLLADRRAWRQGSLLGGLLAVIYGSQTIGLQYTSSGHSAFITSAAVAVVPVILFLGFGERFSRKQGASVLAVLLGLFLLTYDFSTRINAGDAITLLTAAAYAAHVVLAGRFVRNTATLPLIHAQFTAAALVALLAFLAGRGQAWTPGREGALALGYLGLAGTLFCYFVSVWAQNFVNSVKVAMIFSLEPLFAAGFGFLFLGERLSIREGLGGMLMLAGILWHQTLSARRD